MNPPTKSDTGAGVGLFDDGPLAASTTPPVATPFASRGRVLIEDLDGEDGDVDYSLLPQIASVPTTTTPPPTTTTTTTTSTASATTPSSVSTYAMTQESGLDAVQFSFGVPEGTLARHIYVNNDLKKFTVQAGIVGQPPIIEGRLFGPVEEPLWGLEGTLVTIYYDLPKPAMWPIGITGPTNEADPSTIDPHSLYLLGEYELDFGTSKPKSIQRKHLKQAAKRGHTAAQFKLANLLLNDKLDTSKASKALSKAMELYKQAGSAGNFDACYLLGLLLHYGHSAGHVVVNFEEALVWYGRIPHTHKSYAEAQYNMGTIRCSQERFAEATPYFQAAIQAQPSLQTRLPASYVSFVTRALPKTTPTPTSSYNTSTNPASTPARKGLSSSSDHPAGDTEHQNAAGRPPEVFAPRVHHSLLGEHSNSGNPFAAAGSSGVTTPSLVPSWLPLVALGGALTAVFVWEWVRPFTAKK
eukprot:TRINITY_DN1124_c0_g1_i1.p1 TRINITY_DN1124_c0_g1~~TRINITY_DN1124_c0_g1_i1.p1  ORF type:complete len:468 (+),score=97.02 TRINITY_DN1124_c0_g1_i1:91-1494(+)